MRIVVGISGGVDSALAAALLQERGFDVVGCFLKVVIAGAPCPWTEDLPMAHRVATHLNIPLIVRDVSTEYERDVLEPMVAAYRCGETPNPDTTCNRYVKFDALAAVARTIGAERIATGHYARVCRRSREYTNGHESTNMRIRPSDFSPSPREGERLVPRSPEGEVGLVPRSLARPAEPWRSWGEVGEGVGQVELWRGVDPVKDQSYFLWQLTQEQLGMCEFPLGEWHKEDVRQEAKRRDFPNWDRDSTSGVCFLGQIHLTEFLASHSRSLRGSAYDRSNLDVQERGIPATIVTTSGEVIGTIPHAEALTIGQRVPIAGQPAPRYVVATDPCAHRIVVSASPTDPARYTKTITTDAPNWIGMPHTLPLTCTARIRHRQEPVPCSVSVLPSSFRASSEKSHTDEPLKQHVRSLGSGLGMTLRITFATPLTGVAIGQAVVFTDGDRVFGGATITGTAR